MKNRERGIVRAKKKRISKWTELITEEVLLEAIKNSRGIKLVINNNLNKILKTEVPYSTLLDYLSKEDWDFSKELNAEKEKLTDRCELNLIELIEQKKDPRTTMWWLSKMAKERGYGDETPNIQVINQTESKQNISEQLEKLTEEEREQYFDLCRKLNGSEE